MEKEHKLNYFTQLKSSTEIVNIITEIINSEQSSDAPPYFIGNVVPQEINKILKCLEVLGMHHRIFIITVYSTEGKYTPLYKIGVLPANAYISGITIKSTLDNLQ